MSEEEEDNKINPLWYQLEREKQISDKLTDIVYDALTEYLEKYNCRTPIILRCSNNKCLHFSINQNGYKQDVIYCSNNLYKCTKCKKYYCDEHSTKDYLRDTYLCTKHNNEKEKKEKRKDKEQYYC